jgi:hypothetical protein
MLAGDFVSGPDAPGTQVEPDGGPVDVECSGLDVGKPCPPGMLFRVADPVAEPQRFSADITFDSQFITSFRYFTNSE